MPDRDAEFQITATDHSGPATRAAADGFEHLGREADKAKRKIDDLGDESGHLARKLAEARAAAVGLAHQFDATGESKILREFQKVNAEANKLGRVMKTIKLESPKVDNPNGFLGALTKMARSAGFIAGNAAVDGWGDAFKALPAQLQAGIAVAGVAAVVALEGAVTGAVAGGGILTGLIIGAQDDRVKAAYSRLGKSIFADLKQDAAGFTNQLLGAAPGLADAWARESPRVKRIFDQLALDLGPIIDNVVASAEKIGPAIERASAAGGKVLVNLSATLPVLAGATGHLLDSFSNNSGAASVQLNLLVLTVSGAIEAFGLMNDALNPVLSGVAKLGELTHLTGEETHHLYEYHSKLNTETGLTAEQYAKLAYDLGSTVGQARALQESFDRLFNEQMNVDQANLAVSAGLLNLKETIKDNKKTLDESTQSGVENTRVILGQIQALDQKRQADIAAGNGTAEATAQANAAYVSQLEGLRQLLYSLGLNHAEVDRLINAYEELAKPQVKTFTTVYRTQGTPPGYSDQLTGHSRTGSTDYGALDGWGPYEYNARRGFAADGGAGSMPHMPPVQVHSESSVTVLLDGKPFREMITSSVSAAERRQAWRARVGRRSG